MDMTPKFFKQLSPDEERLLNKVGSYEPFFEDMLFRPHTITHDYISLQSSIDGGKTWQDELMDLPDELEYFSYEYFNFCIETLNEDTLGSFNHESQTLTITPESLEKESVILHELIHLHEYVLNDLPLFFHDAYFWCLYKSLHKQIPDLDERIENHGHLFNELNIYQTGGLHDILFLLKSFDLDLKMGYKLGTVFGYGYTEDSEN